MSCEYQKRTEDVVRRMKAIALLSDRQRGRIDSLDTAAWARELNTLAKLWPTCPKLVDEYLDVMIVALHDFPECLETPARPRAARVPASA